MSAAAIRRNAIERIFLPSNAWIDRNPAAALAIIGVLVLISGGF